MKKLLLISLMALVSCDKLIETKACEITNSDYKEDIGQCIKLSKSAYGKDESVAACEATVNSYLKNKYGSKQPDNVLFYTSTKVSCK